MCRHVGWQSVRKRTDLSQKPARRNQSLQLPVCQRIFKENVVFSFGFFYVFNTCWPEFVATMGVKDFRRIIFPCYEVHQLSTFIAGKTIAVDGSVLEHAIMADKEIAGLRQGSGSFFAEVFQYLNTWYTNKNLGCAKAIVWVFDADVDGRASHCQTCQTLSKQRLDEKGVVAANERAKRRQVAKQKFDQELRDANMAIHAGTFTDEKEIAKKRKSLTKHASASMGRDKQIRFAVLFWIVQHNNHLLRDHHGGQEAKKKKKKGSKGKRGPKLDPIHQRRAGYSVDRRLYNRCPISCVMALAEADDFIAHLCNNEVVDVGLTVDTDHVVWGCPSLIVNGANDRRKEATHKVSVLRGKSVHRYVANVLLDVDNKNAKWKSKREFEKFADQQNVQIRGGKPKQLAPDDGKEVPTVQLPFVLNKAVLAECLKGEHQQKKAVVVLATFLGTDFCLGILNAVSAVAYTAWYMQSSPDSNQREVVEHAFAARTINKKHFGNSTFSEYFATFTTAVAHWEAPHVVSMSKDDWMSYLYGTLASPAGSSSSSSQMTTNSVAPAPAWVGGSNHVEAKFPCGAIATPSEVSKLLRLDDETQQFATSETTFAAFDIPCADLDFKTRHIRLWPDVCLGYWLRARGCQIPKYWKRQNVVDQVNSYILRRVTLNGENDTAPGFQEVVLKKAWYFNQFYSKLLRHCFLPTHTRYDVTKPKLRFSEQDYGAVQKLVQLVANAIEVSHESAAGKLSEKNRARSLGLVKAGYVHLSFFSFQDTVMYSDEDPEGQRVVVVDATVVASQNSQEYAVRIGFMCDADSQWVPCKALKKCECISGSELEHMWCTHMASVIAALVSIVASISKPLVDLMEMWPEDIVLMQAQPVRLKSIFSVPPFGSPMKEKRRKTTVRTKLDKATNDVDLEDSLQTGLTSLLCRRHLGVLRRFRRLDIDPTDSVLNGNMNQYSFARHTVPKWK